MSNEVSIFTQALPTYATNAKSKAMQAMAGGLSGGGFGNRISLRNSKFRFIREGEEVGVQAEPTLDVVIFALADHVQRFYYEKQYEAGSKEPPTCYSMDGKVPSPDSPAVQAPACATCPQNVKGSGRQGNTKACAYRKRVVVLAPDDLGGAPYALDVNAMSMFGEQDPTKNLFSFKGYFEKLSAHNMDIAALVTRMSFDDNASVPKIHFTPIRVLSQDDFLIVQQQMESDEVAKMLADMTNEMESNAPEVTPAASKSQGKRVAAQAAPTPAPEPATAIPSTAPKGVGGLASTVTPNKGFGASKPATPAAVQAAQVPKPAAAAKPLTLDLDGLVSFDDDEAA